MWGELSQWQLCWGYLTLWRPAGVPPDSVRVRVQFYEQFDDDEIGALDNAELEGYIEPDSARLQDIVNEYFKLKEKE